ncbi:MAG TPA: PHP domain-containing protein [Pseudonocardiaceae bacterium]|nr:PHP domain-containing protein [Pseudonocardiaceae bacterium]
MRIDLHTHSTVSDGTDTPAELVANAARVGLDVVALTDHDTTGGWNAAADALPSGLTLVRGAELSCLSDDGRGGTCTVHLLGYLYDPQAPAIVAEQSRLRAERRVRLEKMARRMADDGFPIDPDALMASLPPESSVGRPHLARALVTAGVVQTVDEAFELFLTTGKRYHLARSDTPVRRAIQMIADAGGVTVLAHAFARLRGPVVTAEVIADLARSGLTGLEADHPDHDAPTRAELRGIAADLDLLVTGSSDYHGVNKFIDIGQETTDPEMFQQLVARTNGAELVVG